MIQQHLSDRTEFEFVHYSGKWFEAQCFTSFLSFECSLLMLILALYILDVGGRALLWVF